MDAFTIELRKEIRNYNPLPINTLLFSADAKFLIAGGDDETIRAWDMSTFECIQTMENEKWGQITTLALVDAGLQTEGRNYHISLCVGSGRGNISLIPMSAGSEVKPFVTEHGITSAIFSFNDSVEVQAYDKKASTLAIASHSGELKVFFVENLSLKLRWSTSYSSLIPSNIFFVGEMRQNLLAMLLETSELYCYNTSTGDLMWKKSLGGGIGGAAFSDDGTLMLINNLSTGNFDLYRYPEIAATRTILVDSTRRFTKQCRFLEGNKLAICGSDTNMVNIVDLTKSRVVQNVLTGSKGNMTQSVAVTSPDTTSRVLIAAESGGSVFVWEKTSVQETLLGASVGGGGMKEPVNASTNGNWKVIILVVVLTYSSWSPYIFALINFLSEYYKSSMNSPAGENTVIYL